MSFALLNTTETRIKNKAIIIARMVVARTLSSPVVALTRALQK